MRPGYYLSIAHATGDEFCFNVQPCWDPKDKLPAVLQRRVVIPRYPEEKFPGGVECPRSGHWFPKPDTPVAKGWGGGDSLEMDTVKPSSSLGKRANECPTTGCPKRGKVEEPPKEPTHPVDIALEAAEVIDDPDAGETPEVEESIAPIAEISRCTSPITNQMVW